MGSKVTVVHKPLFYDTREKDKLNTSLMGHFICCMNKKSMKIYTVKKNQSIFGTGIIIKYFKYFAMMINNYDHVFSKPAMWNLQKIFSG